MRCAHLLLGTNRKRRKKTEKERQAWLVLLLNWLKTMPLRLCRRAKIQECESGSCACFGVPYFQASDAGSSQRQRGPSRIVLACLVMHTFDPVWHASREAEREKTALTNFAGFCGYMFCEIVSRICTKNIKNDA